MSGLTSAASLARACSAETLFEGTAGAGGGVAWMDCDEGEGEEDGPAIGCEGWP